MSEDIKDFKEYIKRRLLVANTEKLQLLMLPDGEIDYSQVVKLGIKIRTYRDLVKYIETHYEQSYTK